MVFATPLDPIQVKQNDTFGLTPSKNINSYVLAANTAKTITFPLDANGCKPNYAMFSFNAVIYVRWDGSAATIAGSDTADSAGSEICPTNRVITGFTTVSIIAPVATVVSIAYYF